MATYKDLVVWQKAIELVVLIYGATNHFPKHELFGLTSQMRRAAISIPSNIAEGQSRQHLKEYIQFLKTSYGSAAELETQIIIAHKINYLTSEQLKNLSSVTESIKKMLYVLIQKINKPHEN